MDDMDTLDVGDGTLDGLSDVEKQTAITIWAMANSPMYLGGDLTNSNNFAKSAFTNDELIVVDQSGLPAVQVTGRPASPSGCRSKRTAVSMLPSTI